MDLWTQTDLNSTWDKIIKGELGDATYKPERLSSDVKDIMSIPSDDGTSRKVYERKDGGEWKEVPFMGGVRLNDFAA